MELKNIRIALFIILIVALGQTVSAANTGAAMELRLELSSASIREAGLTFVTQQAAATDYRVRVIEHRKLAGSPPRQRSPEVSTDHLVVIGSDNEGREIARSIIIDPRLVRAEHVELPGVILSSNTFLRGSVEFSIMLIDDPRITSIRIYKPDWTGEEWILDLIDEVKLP